jgi:hypothetical protein
VEKVIDMLEYVKDTGFQHWNQAVMFARHGTIRVIWSLPGRHVSFATAIIDGEVVVHADFTIAGLTLPIRGDVGEKISKLCKLFIFEGESPKTQLEVMAEVTKITGYKFDIRTASPTPAGRHSH